MRFDPRHQRLARVPDRQVRTCECEVLEARIALSTSDDAMPAAIAQPAAVPVITGQYPGGVYVLDDKILVHYEAIPRFGANPTITNVRSGSWTNPSIWSLGRVPAAGDRVTIAPDTTVNYLSQSDTPIDTIEIAGSLIFAGSLNTRLVVGNLTVMPTGTLQIGTATAPVASNVTAELVFADQALNLAKDPDQYGNGLIALGTVTIYGTPVNETWVRLAAEPRAGDTSILVSGDISGWRPGKEILLPDSRQVPTGEADTFIAGWSEYRDEEVEIERIEGNRIFLETPLRFDHPGARNATGQIELLPHVALADRNVVIRSENPEGTRGHTFFTARADVDIRYAAFEDLGRTDNFREIDDTVRNLSGTVTHFGTNQSGRYGVFFNHLMGPENPTNTGTQFEFVGNTVEYTKKWGVAVNDSSYGLISRNVVYDTPGAGYVTCSGTEIQNTFSFNISIGVEGTYDDGEKINVSSGDYARGGTGFWFRRGGNIVAGNVAAGSTYAGYVIDGYNSTGPVTLPKFRGADVFVAGQGVKSDLSPAATFTKNEAYGMTSYGIWLAYLSGNNLLPNQPPTTINDTNIWNVLTAGVRAYHTSNVTFNKLLILGDTAAQNRNDTGTRGIDLRYYENRYMVIANSRVEGVRWGIIAPNNDASLPGKPQPTIIQNTVLRNYINILVMPALDNRPSAGAALVVRDVKFGLIAGLPAGPALPAAIDPPANIQMKYSGFNNDRRDITKPSTVMVYNYNQVPGDNFQVFYPEQVSSFVVPQTDPSLVWGRNDGLVGAPMAGLTNSQTQMRWGIAVAGSIAPAGAAATRPEIKGLVAPIQDLSVVTPRVVLVTPWTSAQVGGVPLRVRHYVAGLLPQGASVYFRMDGGTAVTAIPESVLYSLSPGSHTLRAYIGDANKQLVAGTIEAIATFNVVGGSPSAMAAAASTAEPVAFGNVGLGLAQSAGISSPSGPTAKAVAVAAATPLPTGQVAVTAAVGIALAESSDEDWQDETSADEELLSDLAREVAGTG